MLAGEFGDVALQVLGLILWKVPLWARFSIDQKDSIPLVWAIPETYSPTLCFTVSCSKGIP